MVDPPFTPHFDHRPSGGSAGRAGVVPARGWLAGRGGGTRGPLCVSCRANDGALLRMGQTEGPPAKARLVSGVRRVECTGHVLDLSKGDTDVLSVRN